MTATIDLIRPTLEAFLQEPELKPAFEYIAGERIQKPMPKGRHSRLQGKLDYVWVRCIACFVIESSVKNIFSLTKLNFH